MSGSRTFNHVHAALEDNGVCFPSNGVYSTSVERTITLTIFASHARANNFIRTFIDYDIFTPHQQQLISGLVPDKSHG